jgi:hypothetical protein
MRKPLTGEPYAGNPPVRFGGRGGKSLSYPIRLVFHVAILITALVIVPKIPLFGKEVRGEIL